MKKLFLIPVFILIGLFSVAQDDLQYSLDAVNAVIDQQLPTLKQYSEQLETHKEELKERHIVLKYHTGVKDVTEATNEAVIRIESHKNEVEEIVRGYESVWYDQMPNIIVIYTKYGEMKEAAGGGKTDLDSFVDRHQEYMDLMDVVQNDIDYIAADCALLRQ